MTTVTKKLAGLAFLLTHAYAQSTKDAHYDTFPQFLLAVARSSNAPEAAIAPFTALCTQNDALKDLEFDPSTVEHFDEIADALKDLGGPERTDSQRTGIWLQLLAQCMTDLAVRDYSLRNPELKAKAGTVVELDGEHSDEVRKHPYEQVAIALCRHIDKEYIQPLFAAFMDETVFYSQAALAAYSCALPVAIIGSLRSANITAHHRAGQQMAYGSRIVERVLKDTLGEINQKQVHEAVSSLEMDVNNQDTMP